MANLEQIQTLGEQIKADNETAFTELIAQNRKWVYEFAYGLLKNHQDAEESVNDAFLHLWQKRHVWNGTKGTYKGWINIVVRNYIRDIYRKRQAKCRAYLNVGAEGDEYLRIPDPATCILTNLVHTEFAEQVETALEKLTHPPMRLAFLLRHLEGYPVREVCRIMKATEASTKMRIYRACQKLRTILGDICAN